MTDERTAAREKVAGYWAQVEAALIEAGLRFETDKYGHRVVRSECDECPIVVGFAAGFSAKDHFSVGRGCGYGAKPFVLLKSGGFNLKLMVSFLQTELAEKHKRHLAGDAAREGLEIATEALYRAVTTLGLPDLFGRHWADDDRITGEYAGKLAQAENSGTVHFSFDATLDQVEAVLRFLAEQGLVPDKEASDA